MSLQPFKQGPPDLVKRMNEIIDAVNSLLNMSGDGMVKVKRSPLGMALSISPQMVAQRIPKPRAGAGLQYATISTYITFGDDEAEPVIDEVLVYQCILGRIFVHDPAKDYSIGNRSWVPNADNEYASDFYRCIEPNTGAAPPNVTYWEKIEPEDYREINILSAEINGDTADLRKYIPWFAAGMIIPVIELDGFLYINANMIFGDGLSLGWLEDPVASGRGRAACLYR